MSKLDKLKNRLAEALREVAFRIDGQPMMRPGDVAECIQEHFDTNFFTQQNMDQIRAVMAAQQQAGELGFWVPQRGSGSIN
ncbi:MAG: hypothetical protein ACTSX8_03515 [Alphaproteobacteria bacterium]